MIACSLILITIDCLRADHVGFLGYGRPTTPFLDSPLPEPSASTAVATGRRWNGRIANACHKVKSVGALYDELYFQYCQKLASPRALSLDEMRRCPSAQVIVEHACEWLSGIAG